jgi:hypothetical protein
MLLLKDEDDQVKLLKTYYIPVVSNVSQNKEKNS